jgi:hypothetical protein
MVPQREFPNVAESISIQESQSSAILTAQQRPDSLELLGKEGVQAMRKSVQKKTKQTPMPA